VAPVKRSQRAQAIVEAAVIFPALLALAIGAVGVGLVARTDGAVAAVALEAARAASEASTPAQAVTDGQARGYAVARGYGLGNSVQVNVDTRSFGRGGEVSAEVDYTLSLDQAFILGWAKVPFRITRVEPIEPYRSFRQ